MSLKAMLASIKGKNILIPALQDFTAKQARLVRAGKISKKAGVIRDAKLTIKAMQDRIKEFNHGEDPEGEFFHPSSLGGCLRRTWLSLKGAEPAGTSSEDDLRNHFIFEGGTAIHTLIQNLCERAGIMEAREVAIQSVKHKILGHCDVVVKIDGVRYGVEIKSTNLRNFAKVAKQPLHAHKIQAHAYMRPLKLEWMIIVYYCKDTSQLREFVIQFDEAFYKEWVRDRIDGFFQKMRDNEIPDREEAGGENCRYCPFADMCFDKKKVKAFVREVKEGTVVKKTKMKDVLKLLFADE